MRAVPDIDGEGGADLFTTGGCAAQAGFGICMYLVPGTTSGTALLGTDGRRTLAPEALSAGDALLVEGAILLGDDRADIVHSALLLEW